MRIVTSEGHTVVDAAHIVPWSVSQNDDIRNGMALCKLCHWGFEVGQAHNAAGVLLNLNGRDILGPQDRALWPHQAHLEWHRGAFRL